MLFSWILKFVWRCLKQIPPATLTLSLIWRFSFVLLGEIFHIDKKWFIFNQIKMSCNILFDHIFLTSLDTSHFYLLKECVHFMILLQNTLLLCELPADLVWDLERKLLSYTVFHLLSFFLLLCWGYMDQVSNLCFKILLCVSEVRKSAYLNPCC